MKNHPDELVAMQRRIDRQRDFMIKHLDLNDDQHDRFNRILLGMCMVFIMAAIIMACELWLIHRQSNAISDAKISIKVLEASRPHVVQDKFPGTVVFPPGNVFGNYLVQTNNISQSITLDELRRDLVKLGVFDKNGDYAKP